MPIKMSSNFIKLIFVIYIFMYSVESTKLFTKHELNVYKQRVAHMFEHAYNGYLKYAYPYDELRPITCDGHDTWGSYSLTLVDALDTLAVMGNYTEFRRVANLLINTLDFDKDINVSVFETNIRIVGGLLSAHLLSKRAGMTVEEGWPCSGPMLRMSEKVARKLLPAFETKTGMPYGTVNLLYGVPDGETPVTCTSGVTTFMVEFGALSKLTGDPVFENTAMKALQAMWKHKSAIGLVGNHINVQTGQWTALDSGIGAGVDSYFEYLVKGAILFQVPELMEMYRVYEKSIEQYMKKEDWYMWTHMQKGSVTLPVFQSLEAFWPGLQSLLGDVDKAMKTVHNYHQVWTQFGFTPEFYNIPSGMAQSGREGYPLRPELIESLMYLYKATHDPVLLEMGVDILESIEHSAKTRCGYATVKDVREHRLENRMESFFLAETTKYLYLLFDQDNFIHNNGDHGTLVHTTSGSCVIDAGGYVFNTEAHPIDPAALYCCSAEKRQHDIELQNLHNNIDLLTLFDLSDKKNDIFEKAGKQMDEVLKSKEESIYQSILESSPSATKENYLQKALDASSSSSQNPADKTIKINVGGENGGKSVQVTGSTLQDVVKLLQDTASKQNTLQETLSKTLTILGKLTGNTKTDGETAQIDGTNSPPISVIVPGTKGDVGTNQPPVKLDSTSVIEESETTGNSQESETSGIPQTNSDNSNNNGQCNNQPNTVNNENTATPQQASQNFNDGKSQCDKTRSCSNHGDRSFSFKAETSPTRLFMCAAKPFYARFSYMGEMFIEK